MWLENFDLFSFYQSPLGLRTRKLIGQHISELWPDLKGMRVLGIGFPHPYLELLENQALISYSAMVNCQSPINWPNRHRKTAFATLDSELPLPDLSIDRILVIHALEHCDSIRPMMREMWRVLSGNGQIIIIVPNRRGIWSHIETSPFGYGTPYSTKQLLNLLEDTMFMPIVRGSALYAPPTNSRLITSSSPMLEKFGMRYFNRFGGVISVVAKKEIYAPTIESKKVIQQAYTTISNH